EAAAPSCRSHAHVDEIELVLSLDSLSLVERVEPTQAPREFVDLILRSEFRGTPKEPERTLLHWRESLGHLLRGGDRGGATLLRPNRLALRPLGWLQLTDRGEIPTLLLHGSPACRRDTSCLPSCCCSPRGCDLSHPWKGGK